MYPDSVVKNAEVKIIRLLNTLFKELYTNFFKNQPSFEIPQDPEENSLEEVISGTTIKQVVKLPKLFKYALDHAKIDFNSVNKAIVRINEGI